MKPIYIDLITLFFVVRSTFRGWKRGFIYIILKAIGYIGGGVLALVLAHNYGLHHKLPFAATIFYFIALIVGSSTGDALASGIAKAMHKKILPGPFKTLDSLLGCFISIARTIIATAIILTIISLVNSGTWGESARNSQSYKALHTFSPTIVKTVFTHIKKN
jgi:uncharacterized membrane protein required for colicin V production